MRRAKFHHNNNEDVKLLKLFNDVNNVCNNVKDIFRIDSVWENATKNYFTISKPTKKH